MYAQWAAERVEVEEGSSITYWQARADYVCWTSDRRLRPEPLSKQRGTLRAAGARVKGRGDDLLYVGVRLREALPDARYRAGVGYMPSGPETVLSALTALKAGGLVTDRAALNRAWHELSEEKGQQ